MSSLASAVDLLVAVSDLKLVQSITHAINANLPKDGPLGTIRPSSAQLYARPRRYYSPTATIRPVLRQPIGPAPVRGYFDRYDADCRCRPDLCPCPSVPAGPPEPAFIYTRSASPIEPPWKHLPPVRVDRVFIKVQPMRQIVDLHSKGLLLDVFI